MGRDVKPNEKKMETKCSRINFAINWSNWIANVLGESNFGSRLNYFGNTNDLEWKWH